MGLLLILWFPSFWDEASRLMLKGRVMVSRLQNLKIAIKDALGYPVNYPPERFRRFMDTFDQASVDSARIDSLAKVFSMAADKVAQYVTEAKELSYSQDSSWGDGSSMGLTDRLSIYAAVRCAQPKLVVETGTSKGASATYILSALERNGQGRLITIDAAAQAEDGLDAGHLIPERLRELVEIKIGHSLKVLGRTNVTDLDFFLHDSHHRYRYMMAEFDFAASHFSGRGVLCSHDVQMTNAWKHFSARRGTRASAVIKNLGVLTYEAP